MTIFLALAQLLESDVPGVPIKTPPSMLSAVTRTNQVVGILLLANGYQEWKLPALLAGNNGVDVLDADGARVHRTVTRDSRVSPGDILIFPPPQTVSAETRLEWQRQANAGFRDYVLISGDDRLARDATAFYTKRPATVAFNKASATLEWLLAGLNGRVPVEDEGKARDIPSILSPLRDIVLVAHGSYGGKLLLTSDGATSLDYARLRTLLDSSAGLAWRLDGGAFDPRPVIMGTPAPERLVIVGCNIGRAEGFVRVLRRLLNVRQIVAMRHFVTFGKPVGDAAAMSVMLDLRVARPTRLAHVADVVAAVNAAGHRDLNGKPINLDRTVLSLEDSLLLDPKVEKAGPEVTYDVPKNPGSKLFGQVALPPQYRYSRQMLLARPRGLKPDPGNDTDRLEMALADLTAPASPYHDQDFPIWERWSESREDFAETWDWQFKPVDGGFTFQPVRHEYRILVPATWNRPGDARKLLAAQVVGLKSGLDGDMKIIKAGELQADGFPPPGSGAYDEIFATVTE